MAVKDFLPPQNSATQPSAIVPEVMDNAWFLQWAKWMYGRWRGNGCMVNYDGRPHNSEETIEQLRAYGRGRQDVRKYRQILDKEIKLDDNQSAMLLNISWRLPQVFPTYRERIIDRLMEMRYEPAVVAIDEPSIKKKDLMYLRDTIAASPGGRQMIQNAGITPTNITDNALVMDEIELEQYKALGGYQLAAEIALSEAVMATVDLCKLFPSVYRQTLEDLFDLGHAHMEIRHNPGDRMQSVEYIDPEYAVVPNSQYDDGRDITWGGYLRPTTIQAVRMESGFGEAQMAQIAKAYGTRMGNEKYAGMGNGYGERAQFSSGGQVWDPFECMVFTGYFVASKVESHIVGVHDSGSRVMTPVKYGTQISEQSKKKGFSVNNAAIQCVYKFNWVIGTDIVYSCGEDSVVTRDGVPGAMKALIPIVTFRTSKMSVTESCLGVIDDIAINVFKKRHIISKMPPAPNIQVDPAALENVTHLGNMRLMPQDLLDIYTVRGILFATSAKDYDDSFPGQASPPRVITELPNTTLDQLRTIQIDLEMSMQQLMAITGTNEIADGLANPTNVVSGVADIASKASNRALSWLYTANESIQTNIYTQMSKRYQAIASKGEMSIKWLPIGLDTVRVVTLNPEVSLSDFMVMIKPGIDGLAKQALINSVTTYKQGGQISPADEMAVINMIARAQYKKAQFYLSTAVARKMKQDAMISQANSLAQAQAQGQAGVAVEQAKQQAEQMRINGEKELLTLEYQLKNNFADLDADRKIRIAAATKATDTLIQNATEVAA